MMHTKDILAMDGRRLKEHIAQQYENIEKYKKHNAFITVSKGADRPTIAVKDNLTVKGIRATSSSKVIDNYIAPYSATAVERLTGLSIIGKTALDAFGTGSTGSNSDYGPVRNPYDENRVAGGSSAGNGVALALDMCDFALGTDTYGSLRSPSSFCGVVGLRPSYGLVSRYGLMDLSMSLDTIGPMAHDVYGAAYILSMVAGHDERDCLTEKTQKIEYHKKLETDRKLTMVVLKENTGELVDPKVSRIVEDAINKLEEAGVKRVDAELPDLEKSIPMYYLNMAAEFSSAMQKFDGLKYGPQEDSFDLFEMVAGTRGKYLNAEVKRRVILGTFVTMKEYAQKWYSLSIKARARLKQEIEKVMAKGDVLVTPTMPVLPWKIEEVMDDPLKNYSMDLFSGLAPIIGGPALSVPCGKIGKLPVGLQIGAKRLEELKCLQIGNLFEGLNG
jgi:aspartyl-tRNA(Asn)/glutamyl-tRNA(Gln) amidotransferase subunit A